MSVEVDVLGCTHGRRELLGALFHYTLENFTIKPVRSRIAHPEALRRGVRTVGPGAQLQARYPGKIGPGADAEDIAAHRNLTWLGSDAGNERLVVLDVHDTIMPNSNFFMVGQRASKTTIAAAYLLGYTRCVVEPTSFTDYVQNAASLETAICNEADYRYAVDGLYAGLQLLTDYDAEDLCDLYDCLVKDELTYYQTHGVPTVQPGTGWLAPYIPELEAIQVAGAFEEITISNEARQALGIVACGPLYPRSFGHINMSDEAPELGVTDNGIQRRKYLGSLCNIVPGPRSEGAWVVFDEAA